MENLQAYESLKMFYHAQLQSKAKFPAVIAGKTYQNQAQVDKRVKELEAKEQRDKAKKPTTKNAVSTVKPETKKTVQIKEHGNSKKTTANESLKFDYSSKEFLRELGLLK